MARALWRFDRDPEGIWSWWRLPDPPSSERVTQAWPWDARYCGAGSPDAVSEIFDGSGGCQIVGTLGSCDNACTGGTDHVHGPGGLHLKFTDDGSGGDPWTTFRPPVEDPPEDPMYGRIVPGPFPDCIRGQVPCCFEFVAPDQVNSESPAISNYPLGTHCFEGCPGYAGVESWQFPNLLWAQKYSFDPVLLSPGDNGRAVDPPPQLSPPGIITPPRNSNDKSSDVSGSSSGEGEKCCACPDEL